MDEKKGRPEVAEDRSVRWRLLTKILYSLLPGLLGVGTSALLSFSTARLSGVESLLREGAAILALLAVVQGVMTFSLDRLTRGTSDAARLKEQIASAYRAALESSPINPTAARGESHG